MVMYSSLDNVKSGIPLGGIGTGKIEILPTGLLGSLSFQNNWASPLQDDSPGKGFLGFHFGVFIEESGKKISKLLQTIPMNNYPHIDRIEYTGSFPKAKLIYKDKDLPADISLNAMSGIIPHDYKNSGLPGAIFTFTIHNPSEQPLTVSILAAGRNTSGMNGIGRYNTIVENEVLKGISFRIDNPLKHDFTAGEVCISTSRESGEISYLGEWNLHPGIHHLRFDNVLFSVWDSFKHNGMLPNSSTQERIEGGGMELGGALAVKIHLNPGETKNIPFIYSWYSEKHWLGHAYENWFGNSFEVADYIHKNKDSLHEKVGRWHESILSLSIDQWLKDALINNLYVMTSGSWWTRDNKFVLYESPRDCPLMNTVDVRFYASLPVALLFPELELSSMELVRQSQRSSGYIPHDLGYERIDAPSDGTTAPPQWKDLNSKYILMMYRNYLWTHNEACIKDAYPSIKNALEWLLKTDKNGDFLPDNEGADQTFDAWSFYGTNSYSACIFLAALRACMEIAKLNNDQELVMKCSQWYDKGRNNFHDQLWTGKYFKACHSIEKDYTPCTAAQLVGQWYAHMLKLGYILDEEKVKTATKTMCELNGRASDYGAVNAVYPDGTIDKTSKHSECIWPGISYALASLAVYEGFVEEGLAIAKKTWDNISLVQKNPFDQPDVVRSYDGSFGFGNYYMRSMGIWGILIALVHTKHVELSPTLLGSNKISS